MENISKAAQKEIVGQVLDEMKEIEKVAVEDWNATWKEQYTNAYSKDLLEHGDLSYQMIDYIEKENNYYYDLKNLLNKDVKGNIPLKKVRLLVNGEKLDCDFGKVIWSNIKTNNTLRLFSFDNYGNVEMFKENKNSSYDARYNISDDDFYIGMNNKKSKNQIIIENKDKKLTKCFNNFKLIQDFNDGTKTVKIDCKDEHKNVPSIHFESRYDSDRNLEYAFLKIDKHKSNGKVNGTYRIDANWQKGIRVSYYSRKGNKQSIEENPQLIEEFSNLILPILTSKTEENIYISSFINAIKNITNNNINENDLFYENNYFGLDSIDLVENKIDDELRTIKGEIPSNKLINNIHFAINSRKLPNYYDEYRPNMLKKQAKKQSHTN